MACADREFSPNHYLGARNGSFYVLAAERERKLLSQIELGSAISSTATAANGVVYVATMNRLYALERQSGPVEPQDKKSLP